MAVVAAETDARAQWLAGPSKLKLLRRTEGERILLPEPERAAAHGYTAGELETIEARCAGVVIGAQETVPAGLQALVDELHPDELMITTRVHGTADQRRSYALTAAAGRQLR